MRNVLNPCFDCGGFRCDCPKDSARYIGLSFSGCLLDILDGEVSVDQVVAIVAGTKMRDLQESLDSYVSAWIFSDHDKDDVRRLIVTLFDRVIQPRNAGISPIHGSSVWVRVE